MHSTNAHSHSPAYIWIAAMVETSLTSMIHLQEQNNSDLNGKSKSEQKQKLLQEQQKLLISELLSQQEGWFQLKDQFLFPDNPKELLNSERLAIANTNPIHHWFKPLDQNKVQKAKQWCWDKLCLILSIRIKGTNNFYIHHQLQQLNSPSSKIFLSYNKNDCYPSPLNFGCVLFTKAAATL